MSSAINDEIQRFLSMKTDDPRLQASQRRMLESLLRIHPEVREEIRKETIAEGRLAEARAALRRVLSRRKLPLSVEDEARVEACTDLATIERWLEQAVDAPSAAEALR